MRFRRIKRQIQTTRTPNQDHPVKIATLPDPSDTFNRPTRRHVLGGGALVLSASIIPGGGYPAPAAAGEAAAITAGVRIGRDGAVTAIVSQSEMGQGTSTTLAAAIADELYLPFEKVHIEFAPFTPAYRHPVYQWMFTGNSEGISAFHMLARQMGAAAREMLIAAAAARWRTSVDGIGLDNGGIMHPDGRRPLSYGDVAADAAKLPAPDSPKLRADPPSAGRALPRWDIPAKVDGSAEFGIDVKLPDMLLAAVRRAPRFGARLDQHDAASIRSRRGVVSVVEIPDGVIVVAKTYWQARRALDDAKLTWTGGSGEFTSAAFDQVCAERMASGPFFAHLERGDAAPAGATRFEATYHIPFQAHATMEPMNCTARVADGRCEIWAPTQGVELTQTVAAQVTGLPPERIAIHRTLLGGGFGRRLVADFVKLTLLAAMAVKQPVKLIWSREEDMTHDFYRPAMLHKASAVLDQAASPVQLSHRVISPSHLLYVFPRGAFPGMKDWTEPAAPPEKFDPMAVEGLIEAPYDIPGQRVEQHRLDIGVPVSVWRTTGHGANNFVLESFVDELAAAAKRDPVAYRQSMLRSDARALKVLNLVAERSGWGRATPDGTTRGVALAKAFGGYIAAVAEVSVRNSSLKVHRMTMAVDCGRVIDPGIAASNIEGGVVWGLSAMQTEITFERGEAMQSNFDSFEPMHLWQTPQIEVHFVAGEDKPGGTGELGGVPVPAAICNAIYAATGERIRALPVSRAGLSFA
jgi:isoquinoline 1-oxidoreductase beta subunit